MAHEMVQELRALAQNECADPVVVQRLTLAALAELIDQSKSHNHDSQYATREDLEVVKKKLADHDHDDVYAAKAHEHPFAYLAAALAAVAAVITGKFAP